MFVRQKREDSRDKRVTEIWHHNFSGNKPLERKGMEDLENTQWEYEVEGERVGLILSNVDGQKGFISFNKLKYSWKNVTNSTIN